MGIEKLKLGEDPETGKYVSNELGSCNAVSGVYEIISLGGLEAGNKPSPCINPATVILPSAVVKPPPPHRGLGEVMVILGFAMGAGATFPTGRNLSRRYIRKPPQSLLLHLETRSK